jgi:hypothetical protein
MILDYQLLPTNGGCTFLGTLEKELHWAIEKAISRSPTTVLNIGCAEGYYAVGFALRLPHAKVVAAEADPKSRRAIRRNTELNAPGRRVLRRALPLAGAHRMLLKSRAWQATHFGEPAIRLLRYLVDPTRTAIDIGAAEGVYSFFLQRLALRITLFMK